MVVSHTILAYREFLDGGELSKNSIYSIAAQLRKQKLSNDRPSQVHREIGIFGKYWRGIRKLPTRHKFTAECS